MTFEDYMVNYFVLRGAYPGQARKAAHYLADKMKISVLTETATISEGMALFFEPMAITISLDNKPYYIEVYYDAIKDMVLVRDLPAENTITFADLLRRFFSRYGEAINLNHQFSKFSFE